SSRFTSSARTWLTTTWPWPFFISVPAAWQSEREKLMMNKRLFIMASVVLLAGWGAAMAAERAYLPLGWPALLEIHRDWAFAHEGQPDGVPPDYDWAQTPRMGAGNEPDGFNAFTGWGQVFATA